MMKLFRNNINIRHADTEHSEVEASHKSCKTNDNEILRQRLRMMTAAFSLIEAMVVLLIISVSIMALIPLMSKQTTRTAWNAHVSANGRAVDYLYFGERAINRIGIGANPYAPDNSAKVVANTIAIDSTSDAFSPTVLGGDVCGNGVQNGIHIRSQLHGDNGNPINCTNNNIQINNSYPSPIGLSPGNQHNSELSWDDADETLQIYSGYTPVITLKSNENEDNDFTIYNPLSASPNTILMYDHTTSTLSTFTRPQNNVYKNNTVTITGDLIISQSNLNKDEFYELVSTDETTGERTCQKVESLSISCNANYFRSEEDCVDNKNAVQCDGNIWICPDSNNNFLYDNTALPECTAAQNTENKTSGLTYTVDSDKRLKNIISKYTKSIDEVSKIETYNFTYKNDKSARIYVGLIAQKIKGIFDEALHIDEKGFYSYEKTPILYAMVNSVKTIFSRQENLEKKQAKLNAKADKLLKKYE